MDRVLASEISDGLLKLSRLDGQSQHADRIVEIAAEVELLSKDLQQCWGGPLNGQEGRQSMLETLINTASLDAILETGSFRGVTTGWFAEKFSGPVYTCEVVRLYYLQAKANVARFPNVSITMEDSRKFLATRLLEMAGEKRLLVYLDAHWDEDLPLVEELKLLFSRRHKLIVVIDDFRVPGEPGYAYDDYGPGKALTLELLEFLDDPDFRFYFPRLPADGETGARRGVCIVTNGLRDVVDACPVLVGDSWSRWRIKELEQQLSPAKHFEDPASTGQRNLDIRELAEKCDDIKRQMTDWYEKLDTLAVSAEEYREYGKALVEERALNLDLKRRLHDFETGAAAEEDARAELKIATGKLHLARGQLDELRTLMGSIQQSRALQALSTVAPKARLSIMYATQRLEGLINSMR